MFDQLRKSQFLQRVKFDWPLGNSWDRPETLAVTGALITASAKSFQEKFPGSPFYVVFFPSKKSIPFAAALTPILDRAGVPYLTMHGLLDHLERDERTVDRTGHPTALTNKLLAKEIARQLRQEPCCD